MLFVHGCSPFHVVPDMVADTVLTATRRDKSVDGVLSIRARARGVQRSACGRMYGTRLMRYARL